MESEQKRLGVGARAALGAIHGYQGLCHHRASPCRFSPSCSVYAEEAIETHGLLRGGRMALWRIMRCNPFGGHGVDLVSLNTETER